MPESEHRIEGLLTAISEAVAETDETLFEKYFSGEAPARSCVQVAALPKGALFEIEAVAVK